MKRDIRTSPSYKKVEAITTQWLRPGSGEVSDLGEIALSPDGKMIAGAGVLVDKLEGLPGQRICLVDAASGELQVVSSGPRNDRSPRWRPDGKCIAYISDRDRPHDFQVQVRDVASGQETSVRLENLWIEYIHWSPDGRHLLLGAAGLGVDLAGAQGGIASPLAIEEGPAWAPSVDEGAKESHWRSLWIYDLAEAKSRRVSPDGVNVWEACWCGPDAVICIASDTPGEEAWYRADLRRIDIATGEVKSLYTPADQLGWLSASPSGGRIAVVEAVCSDRTIVAGDVLLGSPSGNFERIDTGKVDVTFTAWQSADALMYAGHRSFETVLGVMDAQARSCREIWVSDELTIGGTRYPEAAFGRVPGDAAVMMEGHFSLPTLALVGDNKVKAIRSFGSPEVLKQMRECGQMARHRWNAPDGQEIQGWLLTPRSPAPHALVMDVHGGPVWQWRPRYVGRTGYPGALLREGYAVFQPNVRGASGRGQAFARAVFGDMGGADTYDYLSGLDSLEKAGVADRNRIGVAGGSYGGYMSSWLITQDDRFAAAAPFSPVTDWVSEHLTCQIPHFCEMFLDDKMTNLGGKYFTRSPITYASRVKTPTLNVCGALDRNTPPGQALEFHQALRLHGVKSVLVTYPQEGHGVRNLPAQIDFVARVLDWFNEHMPATLAP